MSRPQKVLYILRGLPGSGKSTLALSLYNVEVFSADDHFMVEGEYRFDPSKLPAAHAACQDATLNTLEYGTNVAVANTFTQRWEIEPYVKIAAETGSRLVIIDLFDGGMTDEELAQKNVHGVPVKSIRDMRARWEHDWRAGDPRPPWQRK